MWRWTSLTVLALTSSLPCFAQSPPDSQLRYKVYYKCNGERVQVDHCRKDDDRLGIGPPTKPQENYCLVYYPDRPQRGGFMVQTAELHDDIIKKLQACGALAADQPASPAPDGANAQSYFEKGHEYMQAKDFSKAVPQLLEAVRLKPDYGEAWVYLGTAYFVLHQFSNAEAAFQQCIKLKPDNADAVYLLGLTYVDEGKKDAALEVYRTLRNLNEEEAGKLYQEIQNPPQTLPADSSADAIISKANQYLDQKEFAKAVEAYKQAIAIQPSSGAYLDLGYAYYQLSQYQNALGPFEQAVRLKPDDFSNHYWVGVTHFQLNQFSAALTSLQEALRLNPNDSNSYHWMGEVYLDGFKQYEKAADAFLACRRLDPNDARNHNELGLAFDNLKQYEKALTEFQEATRLKPGEPLYQSNLGFAYLRLKKIDEAEKVQATLEKLDPKMAEELDKQIFAQIYDMQHAGKQQSTSNAPPPQPAANTAEAYFAEGEKYYQAKDLAKAVPLFIKAVQLKPDFANAWGRLATSYYSAQQYKDALTAFQKCVLLVPSSSDALFALGMTYLKVGDKDHAAEAYKKLQSMNPDEAKQLYAAIQGAPQSSPAPQPAPAAAQSSEPPNAAIPMARQLLLLGTLNEQQGKQDEALQDYKRAIALHPDPDTLAMAYLNLGSLLADQKKFAEAVSNYQESLRLQPKVAHTSFLLGIAYLGMGKKDEALKVYQDLQPLDKDEAAQLYRNIQNAK